MSVESLTITLPEPIVRRLQQAAQTMQVSVGDVLVQTIRGNLPPALADLPDDMQTDFAQLQSADSVTLWRIAQESPPPAQSKRHESLIEQNREQQLSPIEAAELARLRVIADRFVLRRSYALTLLKWRGHTISDASQNGD